MPSNNTQNRYPAQNTPRSAPQRRGLPAVPGMGGAVVVASLILGICLIIAGSSVSGSVKKLTSAVEAQKFGSSFSAPSDITVYNTAPKQYFTETEAADYLNVTADDIKNAIKSGDIDEYIKTKNGYSISKDELDSYFENAAYNRMVKENSSDS
ncbi:MAG: hypothetical protein II936_03175 [Oscillospiraceae bacterium]|nr:hypothetical protein [Oscillospiraceae bacterium]